MLQKEDGYIIRSEESFGHVRSYHLWNNRKVDGGTTTQTSENETGGDSGRDTKESPSSESPYSYDATTDTEWIELKDCRLKLVYLRLVLKYLCKPSLFIVSKGYFNGFWSYIWAILILSGWFKETHWSLQCFMCQSRFRWPVGNVKVSSMIKKKQLLYFKIAI